MDPAGFPIIDDEPVEVVGLAALLEDEPSPFLELLMRCRGERFHVTLLPVEMDWAVTIRREAGDVLTRHGELFPTQTAALVAAMLMVHGGGYSSKEV